MHDLETERLRLRRLTTADAPFILRLLNDPSFVRFIGDKGVRDLAGAEKYIQDGPVASYARHQFGLLLVALRSDASPIGICGLIKRDVLDDVDIGFAYLPEFCGCGYATEAARNVLNHGRTVHGLKRIVAITAPENTASQHVLQKVGLRLERRLRLPGFATDSCLFSPAS